LTEENPIRSDVVREKGRDGEEKIVAKGYYEIDELRRSDMPLLISTFTKCYDECGQDTAQTSFEHVASRASMSTDSSELTRHHSFKGSDSKKLPLDGNTDDDICEYGDCTESRKRQRAGFTTEYCKGLQPSDAEEDDDEEDEEQEEGTKMPEEKASKFDQSEDQWYHQHDNFDMAMFSGSFGLEELFSSRESPLLRKPEYYSETDTEEPETDEEDVNDDSEEDIFKDNEQTETMGAETSEESSMLIRRSSNRIRKKTRTLFTSQS
jgi:hypothetical protein